MASDTELKIGLSLVPYTLRYDNGGGCVVFPFRAEYERELILLQFAATPNVSGLSHTGVDRG